MTSAFSMLGFAVLTCAACSGALAWVFSRAALNQKISRGAHLMYSLSAWVFCLVFIASSVSFAAIAYGID
jgi:hypothetical protein